MVVFTCEACNESLKKNKVETHLFKCRRSRYVTCIDCQMDFDRESYKAHTSCITEMEKYSGPGYVPKASANKGAKKQDDWFQRVQSAIDGCAASGGGQQLSRVLYKVRESANVPRKQAKFVNFCRNSMKWASPAVIQQAWSLLAEGATSAAHQQPPPAGPDGDVGADESKAKKRPAGADDVDDEAPEAKKKKKDKKRQSEESAEAEAVAMETLVEGQKNPRKKKRNKAEEVVDPLEAAEVVENPEPCTDVERKKKKKKKKAKSEEGQEEPASENANDGAEADGRTQSPEPVPVVADDDDCGHSKKKKKKKKKRIEETQEEPASENARDGAEAGVVAEDANCGQSKKKKKKKKKKQHEENGLVVVDDSVGAVSVA